MWLGAIVLAGTLLRLVFVVAHADIDIAFDQKFYYRQATALAAEGSLPDEYVVRPPVYAAFLAGLIPMFGSEVNNLRLAQVFLSALSLCAVYLLARKLLSAPLGLVATGLVAVFPASVVGPWLLLTEVLFTPLLLLALWATVRGFDASGGRHWLLIGAVFWALAALTRAAAAGYFFAFTLVLFIFSRRIRIRRWTPVLAGIVFLLVISPWTIRNYNRYGGFMLIDNTASFNLWLTNTEGARIQEFTRTMWKPAGNPVERQREGFRKGAAAVLSDPAHYAWRCGRRFSRFWEVEGLYPTLARPQSGQTEQGDLLRAILTWASAPAHWIVLILACLGMAWSLRRRPFLLLTGFVAYLSLAHSLLVANARHRAPLVPLLAILAVLGASATIRWIGDRRRTDGADPSTGQA